jgi:ribonuclease HII
MQIPQDVVAALDQCSFVLGVDECGIGSLAGPLTVCAAITPRYWTYPGVTDSKKLTPKARGALYPHLVNNLLHYVVNVDSQEVDEVGVWNAHTTACMMAIEKCLELYRAKGFEDMPCIIVDGNKPIPGAISLIKGDLLIPAISAASIIGKVVHDTIMAELDEMFPGYHFKKSAGYGTKAHLEGLAKLGPSPVHRMSYAPLNQLGKQKPGHKEWIEARSDPFADMALLDESV